MWKREDGHQVIINTINLDEDHEIFKGYLTYSSSWSKIAKNL